MEKLQINNILLASLLIIFCLSSCKSIAQTPEKDSTSMDSVRLDSNIEFELVAEINVWGHIVATNQLNQIYVVDNDDEVIKYSSEGEELYRYSNFDLGEISHIDASNPFNLLIFYEEFQTVEILDRRLNKLSEFDLFKSASPNIRAVGISSDQQIWIYDELNFKLKKLNTSGEVIFESADLSNIVSDNYSPSFVLESGGNIYLSSEDDVIFQFDIFGNYINVEEFNIPTAKLQLVQGVFVYRKDNVFYLKNPMTGNLQTQQIVIPKTDILDAELQKNRIMILEMDQLSIYTFDKKN